MMTEPQGTTARSSVPRLRDDIARELPSRMRDSFSEFADPAKPHVNFTLEHFLPEVSPEQLAEVMKRAEIMSLDVYHRTGEASAFEGELAMGQCRVMLHRNWPMNPPGAIRPARVFGKLRFGASEMVGIVNRLDAPDDPAGAHHLSFLELQRRGAPTPSHQQNATWSRAEKDGIEGVTIRWQVDTRTMVLPAEGTKINDWMHKALQWWAGHQMGADLTSKIASIVDVLEAGNEDLRRSVPLKRLKSELRKGGKDNRWRFPTYLPPVRSEGPSADTRTALAAISAEAESG